ncbi:MAG: CapA family protein [Acidimicrobiia bacterium]|nr:CapA family protein [Acidimicrobiia bacterium]
MKLRAALLAVTLLAAACGETAVADPVGAEAVTGSSTTTPTTTEAETTSTTTTSTTTTSTTTTTTTTTLPPVVLGFAGDTSFTHGNESRGPLVAVTELLAAPDFMVVNLETTVTEPGVGTKANKTYTFRSPPESVDLLTEAGIDAVSLANNHTLDFARPALLRTVELLDAGGVQHFGAGPDPDAAYAPLLVELGGRTLAFVGLNRVPCDWSASGENTRPEVAWTCDAFVPDALAAVAAADEVADFTVVMVHWGIETKHCIEPWQRDLATAYIDRGADLVVGAHPHRLQGVEMIDGVWVAYSMGNFAFPSGRNAGADTGIFLFELNDAGVHLRVQPLRGPAGIVSTIDAATGDRILSDLTDYSFGVAFDEDGVASRTDEGGTCG